MSDLNQIYADVNEDDSVGEPNFQWVVLASEALAREAALREELDRNKSLYSQLEKALSRVHCMYGKRLLDLTGERQTVLVPDEEFVKYFEELKCLKGENSALQQRLTVAEQRLSQVEGACDLAMSAIDDDERGANFVKIIQAIKDKAALKPAAKPHKCIECESQYCHGVCVERGDDDERYKGAEGEGS